MSVSDRFVEFLRRVAAGYNAPPPTPRDAMWAQIESLVYPGASAEAAGENDAAGADPSAGRHGADSSTDHHGAEPSPGSEPDMDRFVEFLREAAAGYNAPPPTPRDEMWGEVESRLALEGVYEALPAPDAISTPDPVSVADPLSAAAAAYHDPPPPPRDEMWGRIEAAWQMRRSAGPAARDAGLDPLPAHPAAESADSSPARAGRDRRRTLMVTGTGLALAASLVIGIAIGRRSTEQLRSDSSPTTLTEGPAAAASTDPAEVRTPGELAAARDPLTQGEPGSGAQDTPSAAGPGETLETAPPPGARLVAAEPQRIDRQQLEGERRDGGRLDPETGRLGAAPPSGASRRDVVVRYAMAEHLGRAEALLTAFRTDPETANGEISRWAGELLAETRLLMDLPGERDPRTTALLQELELILALIAALGDDAPSGERAHIASGLDQQGTLPRLRAAMPSGPVGAGRVGT